MRINLGWIGLALAGFMGSGAAHGQACIEDVGALTDVPQDVPYTTVMTPDGQGYAGEANRATGGPVSFFWSPNSGLRTMPFDPSTQTGRVVGTSKTGAFVIIHNGTGWRRWETESGSVRTIPFPEGAGNMALVRVTTTGDVYARGFDQSERRWYAWRWTEDNGFTRLRDASLTLSGISHDGRVRIGTDPEPRIWRSSTGEWDLMDGFPDEELSVIVVEDLSGDGPYATGMFAYPPDDQGITVQEAFRWHDGVVETMPGAGENWGRFVTDDGVVIAEESDDERMLMWTADGVRSVYDVVVEAGLDPAFVPHALQILPDGRCDCRIWISDDGTVLHSNAPLKAVRLNGGCARGLRGLFDEQRVYDGGNQRDLRWIASGIDGDVTVEFSPDGEDYELIGAATAYPTGAVAGKSNRPGGFMPWTIPHVNTTNAHLRFSAAGVEHVVGPFTIQSEVTPCPTPPPYTWRGEGISFNTTSNWDPDGPPGEGELARFDRDTFVPVELSESVTTGAMEVLAGRVSIDGRGHSLSLTDQGRCVPNLLVDNGAELSVQRGNISAGQDVRIADGTVELSEDGHLLAGRLYLAESGAAAISVATNGGFRVDSLLAAAVAAGSVAEITVDSSDADDAILLPLHSEIGVRGAANLTVSGAARVVGPVLLDPADQPAAMVLGVEQGSEGTVTFSGSDLRLFWPDDDGDRVTSVTVGDAGSGVLHLSGGARTRLDTVTVAESGSGTIRIDSTSGLWVDRRLRMGVAAGSEAELVMDGVGPEDLGASVLLGGHTELGVGGAATVRLSGNSLIANSTSEEGDIDIVLGVEVGGEGRLIVSDAGAELLLRETGLTAGEVGTGEVRLSDGAQARIGTLSIASGNGSGSVVVSGGAALDVEAPADAGYLGELQMGSAGDAEASLLVTGSSDDGEPTSVTVEGFAAIGQYGMGTMSVEDGGNVHTGAEDVVFGAYEGSEGTLEIAGEGSTFEVLAGNLVIGDGGKGDLQVTDGGRLDVDLMWIGKGSTGFGSAFAGGAGTTILSSRLAVGTGAFGLFQVTEDAFVQTDLIWIGENGQVEGRVLAVGEYTPLSKSGMQQRGLATDTLVISAGASMVVDSVVFGAGAVLGGSGPLAVDYVNRGTLAPGDSADVSASAGRFTIDAAFVQTAGGALAIDLGGPDPASGHDQLHVTGTAVLDGTLRLTLIDGYVPRPGDTYEIVTAANIEGAFAAVEPPEAVEITLSYESSRVVAHVGEVTVAAERPGEDHPSAFALEANYPNPFNLETTIRFELPESSEVRLTVFDALGRRVAVLVDGLRATGSYEIVFEAAGLPSGTYIYRMEAGAFQAVERMVLVKW